MTNKIETKTGDLMSVTSGYIVHGCNAQGVMGSGVAKLIRDKYPDAYNTYKNLEFHYHDCDMIFPVGVNAIYEHNQKLFIVNAVTQEFYGRDSKRVYVDYKAINKCFLHLNNYIMMYEQYPENKVVNFPLIGCGLANGEWSIVEEIINNALDDSITKILWNLPKEKL